MKWGPFEKGDILDRKRLDEVISQYKPVAIMHFAAFAYVGESVDEPGKYYRNNVVGSLTLLEAMRDHGVPYIIFSSTCATYGEPEQIPIPENHKQSPINPYGHSKLMIEQMLSDFDVAHGIRSVSLRYFNAAGADPDGETGEDHDPETHLIPLVLDAADGKRPSITIFGDDYNTPDGTCIRDYIHVTDLADAHVKALKYLEQDGETTKFNLGNGKRLFGKRSYRCRTRCDWKRDTCSNGKTPPRRSYPRLVCDAERIRKVLNWSPEYADLETILDTAWSWHQR